MLSMMWNLWTLGHSLAVQRWQETPDASPIEPQRTIETPVYSGTARTMKGGWRGTHRRSCHSVRGCLAVTTLIYTIWYSEFYGILLYNLRRLESLGIHSVHSIHITLSTVVRPRARDLWWTGFPHALQNSLNFIGILLYNLRRLESPSVQSVHITPSTVVRPGARDLWWRCLCYALYSISNLIV